MKVLSRLLIAGGLIVWVTTAGSSDINVISMSEILKNVAIGLSMIAGGVIIKGINQKGVN